MTEAGPLAAVRRFFSEHPMAGETVLAAVSGGPDSVCLLHALWTLREELGIQLQIGHLNHQLRGADSDADAAYVKALGSQLRIPTTVGVRDAAAYQKEHRLSPEEAAREVRYRFLAEAARDVGATVIAAGHTADDRAETVLMNLLRGAGTRGLRGLRPASQRTLGKDTVTIIRPLLEVGREATEAYCAACDLAPRRDATNLDTAPARNRVRRELIPALRAYNPNIMAALLRTARLAADDTDYIDGEVEKLLPSLMTAGEGYAGLDKTGLAALPMALRRAVLRAAILQARGTLKDIEAGHVEECLDALGKPAGTVIGLPDGFWFSIEYDRCVIARDTAALCPLPVLKGEHHLAVPGTTRLPGWEVEAAVGEAGKEPPADDDAWTGRFDYDVTGAGLTVRPRRPGDRFHPLGAGGGRKLNRFLIDEKVPRSWRARVPVVTGPEGIVWVAGRRIDERVKVTDATRRVLRLRFRRA
jgi:tRNA(Ile)-lysidine synthase